MVDLRLLVVGDVMLDKYIGAKSDGIHLRHQFL